MENNLVDEHEGKLLQLSILSFDEVDRYTRVPWVVSWNGTSSLSKDRLTKIKSSILYVKPKVWLFWVGDNYNYSLKLGSYCVVSFVYQAIVEGVKKKGKKLNKVVKTLTTETWYLEKIYSMCHTIGNRWIEYLQAVDLLDWPSNM